MHTSAASVFCDVIVRLRIEPPMMALHRDRPGKIGRQFVMPGDETAIS